MATNRPFVLKGQAEERSSAGIWKGYSKWVGNQNTKGRKDFKRVTEESDTSGQYVSKKQMSLRFLTCINQDREYWKVNWNLLSKCRFYIILVSESRLNIKLVRTLKQMEINCHIFFLWEYKTSKQEYYEQKSWGLTIHFTDFSSIGT